MSNLVQKVKWKMPNSPEMEMYMYGEASVEANKEMQEPLKKLYKYENSISNRNRKIVDYIQEFDNYVRNTMKISSDENIALFEHWIDCMGEIQKIISETK